MHEIIIVVGFLEILKQRGVVHGQAIRNFKVACDGEEVEPPGGSQKVARASTLYIPARVSANLDCSIDTRAHGEIAATRRTCCDQRCRAAED